MCVDYPTDDEVQKVIDMHGRVAKCKSAMATPPPRVPMLLIAAIVARPPSLIIFLQKMSLMHAQPLSRPGLQDPKEYGP